MEDRTGQGSDLSVASGPALIMAKARSFKDRGYGQGRPVDLAKAGKHAYDIVCLATSYRAGVSALVAEWKALSHHLLKGKTLGILTDELSSAGALGPRLAAGFIRANTGPAAGVEDLVSQQLRAFVDAVR